jgi:arginine utilization protein RocB
MELNDSFCEQVGDEITPPPTSLMMRDLKTEYSVQIPHTSVSMYNLLMMNRSFSELHEKLVQMAKEAAINVEAFYQDRVQRYNQFLSFAPLDFKVNVFTYQELLQKAISKYGDKEIKRRINDLSANCGDKEDRDFSTKLVADLAGVCREYAPMIVVFYSPPYYPAVSSKEDLLIQKTVGEVITHAKANYQIELKQQHYFPGLCDLSFVQLTDKGQSVAKLTANMPLHGNYYHLPLQEIQSLNIPVLNIGPVGRDPHKWTERLHIPYSFDIFPELLSFSIKTIFAD